MNIYDVIFILCLWHGRVGKIREKPSCNFNAVWTISRKKLIAISIRLVLTCVKRGNDIYVWKLKEP